MVNTLKVKEYFIPNKKNEYTPHLLTRKAFLVYVVILIILNIFFAGFGLKKVKAQVDIHSIVNEHNKIRSANRLSLFAVDGKLNNSAKSKAELMIKNNCWSHLCEGSPGGISEPWGFFDEAGFSYIYAGENLAEGFTTVDGIVSAWMNSKTHSDNILSSNYTHIGVAIVEGNFQNKYNNLVVVIHFGKPQSGSSVEPFIDINTPFDNDVVNISDFNLEGQKSDEIKKIEVYLDNDLKGSVIASGSNFTFKPNNIESDKKYSVEVKGFSEDESITVSENINVIASAKVPIISKNKIQLKLLENDVLEITINPIIQLISVNSSITDGQKVLEMDDTKWKIEIPFSEVIKNKGLNIYATSKTKESINVYYSADQISDLMQVEKLDNFENIFTTKFIKKYVDFLFNLDIKSGTSIVFIIFLIILFLVDYYVLKGSDLLHQVNRKSHLQLVLFVILFIVLNSGSVIGTIATVSSI